MSGKQKECGYSWTSGGEIHTCSLPEGHTEAHICGFVFNPSDCCLERAAPTPHEVEAVPEPCCEDACDAKNGIHTAMCHLRRNPAAPVVSTAAPEPPECPICGKVECMTGLPDTTPAPEPHIVVRDGHKRECASNLRIAMTQGMNVGVGPAPWQNGKPVYIPIPACNCGAESAVAPESYKPAEGPKQSAMIALYAIIRESEFGRTGKLPSDDWIRENMVWWLTHGVEIEKTREHSFLKPAAATPVTVEAPAQPPCSECATPSEINLPWTVSGDSPSNPPMVWDASGDSIVNQMPDGTPYFEPEVAAFIGKAANSLAAHELECATLRKERDGLRDENYMLRHAPKGCSFCGEFQGHTAECWTVKTVDRLSAAEAQLSTLEKWFMDHWNEIDRAGIYDRYLIRAALAPTPEVAPKE